MDSLLLFDTLYRMTSKSRETSLFGSTAPLAREAFERSRAKDIMPIVWFELPLTGEARFDLHVAYANKDLHTSAPFAATAADGHGELLNWFASETRGGGGLALAYDVGDGRIEDPAIHVNVNGASEFDDRGFFEHVGRPDATELYRGFTGRIPEAWPVWYFGVHPGRPGAPVRVDCFVKKDLQASYAQDTEVLAKQLREAGVAATPELLEIGRTIAASPFGLEMQFDVLGDGSMGSAVSFSASFPMRPASKARPEWEEGGDVYKMMEFAQGLGMCDDRWRGVKDCIITTAVAVEGMNLMFYCVPVFVKMRTRDGSPLDAKIYLQAGAMELP